MGLDPWTATLRAPNCPMKNPLRSRMFAWWYFTIAGGFLLLAINRWLLGQRAGLVVAQLDAAGAFTLFGAMSWKG